MEDCVHDVGHGQVSLQGTVFNSTWEVKLQGEKEYTFSVLSVLTNFSINQCFTHPCLSLGIILLFNINFHICKVQIHALCLLLAVQRKTTTTKITAAKTKQPPSEKQNTISKHPNHNVLLAFSVLVITQRSTGLILCYTLLPLKN